MAYLPVPPTITLPNTWTVPTAKPPVTSYTVLASAATPVSLAHVAMVEATSLFSAHFVAPQPGGAAAIRAALAAVVQRIGDVDAVLAKVEELGG